MDLGISGRTAAVAAGSAGLGLGAAKALAADGVRVAICGRDGERLAAAVDAIGGDAVAVEADVSNPGGGAAFVQAATAALGHVDILVPNAGGPPPGTFASTDLDAYQAALDMNCLSMIEMCRSAIPAMRDRGWGRVCCITSVGVRHPIGALMASSVARAALTSFVKITSREVAGDGVTVNSAQPGLHWTARVSQIYDRPDDVAGGIPTRVVGDADDFGAVVAFLCSEQAKFITGTGVLVDGGASTALSD